MKVAHGPPNRLAPPSTTAVMLVSVYPHPGRRVAHADLRHQQHSAGEGENSAEDVSTEEREVDGHARPFWRFNSCEPTQLLETCPSACAARQTQARERKTSAARKCNRQENPIRAPSQSVDVIIDDSPWYGAQEQ